MRNPTNCLAFRTSPDRDREAAAATFPEGLVAACCRAAGPDRSCPLSAASALIFWQDEQDVQAAGRVTSEEEEEEKSILFSP